MSPEDVTLIVPCYNVAGTLPQCLRSVYRLDPGPSTILCVDDGSTDGTKSIIESHESAQLIEHDENQGIATTLNTALAHTETPLFAKVDADIVVPPNWLAKMLEIREEREAALIQGRFVEQTTTAADKWRAAYPSPTFEPTPEANKAINGGTILADTEALRDVDGWDEQYRRAFDDIDLMNRLMAAGYEIYYAPSVRSTHIRTDTWREVLRTAWAYHNDPVYGGEPEYLSDVFSRFQHHLYVWIRCVYRDLKRGDHDLFWISALRLPYHVMWDIEHVIRKNS